MNTIVFVCGWLMISCIIAIFALLLTSAIVALWGIIYTAFFRKEPTQNDKGTDPNR